MGTRIVFETSAIADAVKKADKVAPGRGRAFDKAAGLIMEITPGATPPVQIRATNLDVFHTEWVDAIEVTGEKATWRIPSSLIANVMGTLPIGTGKTVTLEEITRAHGTSLQLTSGRTKAKFNLMLHEDYPVWDVFDPDDLTPVQDLGGRISMVEWAAAKGEAPLCGIFFNGEQVICTDRYRLACAPMKIDGMGAQMVIPAGLLGSILKQTGEVMIGFTPHQFLIMPNDQTQLRVTRFAVEYPNVAKIMNREFPATVEISKNEILEIIGRATTFASDDRLPTLRMFFGLEEIAVMIANEDVGHLGDVMPIPGQALHDRCEIKFTPKNLVEAIAHCPNDQIKISYDPDNTSGIMYLDGGSGYEAWVVTRKESEAR